MSIFSYDGIGKFKNLQNKQTNMRIQDNLSKSCIWEKANFSKFIEKEEKKCLIQ